MGQDLSSLGCFSLQLGFFLSQLLGSCILAVVYSLTLSPFYPHPPLPQVCCHYLPLSQVELPISLLTRLALTDPTALNQFVNTVAASPRAIIPFLSVVLLSDLPLLTSDLLSLLAHTARVLSPSHLSFIQELLAGCDESYRPLRSLLGHPENSVRARTYGLLGHLLQHSMALRGALQSQAGLLNLLLLGLGDEDPAVRRSASFAVGNAAYQAGPLGPALAAAVPSMTQLLGDPQAGIRRNAVSALGNLGPEGLGEELLQCQVPQRLLEMACGDPQLNVKEAALVALRSLRQEPCIHQVYPRGLLSHNDQGPYSSHWFSEIVCKDLGHPEIQAVTPWLQETQGQSLGDEFFIHHLTPLKRERS